MKRLVRFQVILLCMLIAVSSYAGDTKNKKSKKAKVQTEEPLVDDNGIISFKLYETLLASSEKTLWVLAFEYKNNEYMPKSPKWVEEALLDKEYAGKLDKNIAPYKTELGTAMNWLKSLGGDTPYFMLKDADAPFRMVNFNGKKAMVMHSLGVSTVYNSFKLSTKERAANVFAKNIIPAVKTFSRAMKDTKIDTYGIFITYGSKDFVNEKEDVAKGEVVGIIASRDACRQLYNAEISDQEFADKVAVLISDRDDEFSFARVKLTLK